MSLALLKQRLAEVVGTPKPGILGLPTGVEVLDAALPARGIPRGRLTEIIGTRGSGKTTLLRHLVEATAAHGLWVAYIDAARTLAPRHWAHVGREGSEKKNGTGDGVWMVRPPTATKGAWCADVLLRSGAFELVVLDSAPPLARSVAVRLTRLARDSNAAFVVVSEDERGATTLAAALRLRVHRAGSVGHRAMGGSGSPGERAMRGAVMHPAPSPMLSRRSARLPICPSARRMPLRGIPERLVIAVEKGGGGGGIHRTVEVSYAVTLAHRLCTHPEVPDRRGVERSRAGPTLSVPGTLG